MTPSTAGRNNRRQRFRVEMKRKAGMSQYQDTRRKALEVLAQNADEAKQIALRMDGNSGFFVVDTVKEIR